LISYAQLRGAALPPKAGVAARAVAAGRAAGLSPRQPFGVTWYVVWLHVAPLNGCDRAQFARFVEPLNVPCPNGRSYVRSEGLGGIQR